MTRPAIIDHNETVSAANISYLIMGRAHRITFLQGSDDDITNLVDNARLFVRETNSATITDQAQGTHIDIDRFSLMTTIRGFQNDDKGEVWLTHQTFTDMAAVAAALTVIPDYGSVLGAQFHGPVVVSFPGDYDVLNQIHLSRA